MLELGVFGVERRYKKSIDKEEGRTEWVYEADISYAPSPALVNVSKPDGRGFW